MLSGRQLCDQSSKMERSNTNFLFFFCLFRICGRHIEFLVPRYTVVCFFYMLVSSNAFSDNITSQQVRYSFLSVSITSMLSKPVDIPTGYRPISLLWCCYKLMGRLLLKRLGPMFESIIPPEETGFWKKRNTCDQVFALTSYIESGFQKKLKTGAVFIDLSAAYDTV